MASAPQNTKKKSTAKSAAKKPAKQGSKRLTKAEKEKQEQELLKQLRRRRQISAVVLFAVALFLACVYLFSGEAFWASMHTAYWGCFGFCGILLPVLLGYIAYQRSKEKPPYRLWLRILMAAITVTLFSTAVYLFSNQAVTRSYFDELAFCYQSGASYSGGGVFSAVIGAPMLSLIGKTGSRIVIILLLFVTIMIISGATLISLFDLFKKPVNAASQKAEQRRNIRTLDREQRRQQSNSSNKNGDEPSIYIYGGKANAHINGAPSIDIPLDGEKRRRRRKSEYTEVEEKFTTPLESEPKVTQQPQIPQPSVQPQSSAEPNTKESASSSVLSESDTKTISQAVAQIAEKKKGKRKNSDIVEENASEMERLISESNNSVINGAYIKPPVTLLEPTPMTDEGDVASELNHNGTMLIDMLKSFGVTASIVNICRGPSVTRYELQPAAGVKISKITNLSDDIAMNLAAVGVRIEAPIPGKSAVGIEVPNKVISIVKMREIIDSQQFKSAKGNLTVALGRDIEGDIVLADLSKMPHLLIAGSTGSGKSVCINSMLVSLLYKSSPEDVKMILIDPKVVELGIYNDIPHLLVPVVTDPRKAAGALNWAVNHMLERYKIFAENNVRDIKGYNALVEKLNAEDEAAFEQAQSVAAECAEEQPGEQDEAEYELPHTPEELQMMEAAKAEAAAQQKPVRREKRKKMEQVVIVIDELADLMMAAPNEVESSICRLAQMARAAGMHLVIATQRPSVDVITGVIKANIPSRIAFAVKSQIDSRTILDTGGADKLLGRGDMLFAPIGASKPTRVQGCFVNDEEIENVINFVKNSKTADYDTDVIEEIERNAVAEKEKGGSSADNEGLGSDPMMEEAIKVVVEAGQASTSLLQRRLRLGYARAGRLIDEMEQMGIVGPHEGSKPRQVLMTHQQWLERCMSRQDGPHPDGVE